MTEHQQTSPLHYWIGIVAEDKDPDSISIEVMVNELTPSMIGQVNSETVSETIQLKDINNNPIQKTATSKTTITAYYFSNATNRKYPPDVVKGEQVRIFRYGDSDKYYWESLGRDDQLRKTERLRLESKNRTNFDDPSDDAHTYSIEIDTKVNKHIRLLTSTGTGEKNTYILHLDAKNSKVRLSDDVGNAFTIDTGNARVIMQNSQKSFCMLNGQDIVLGAPRDISIKAGRQMLLNSPLISVSNTQGAGILEVNSNAVSINGTNNVVVTSPAIGLNGAVKIPQILAVNNLRAATIAGTSVGSPYQASKINMNSGGGTVTSNSPDTTMPTGQRHGTAQEQFTQAMSIVTNCFNQIQSKMGLPSSQNGLSALADQSKMNNLTGV